MTIDESKKAAVKQSGKTRPKLTYGKKFMRKLHNVAPQNALVVKCEATLIAIVSLLV